jgi:hypothetical protein
VSKLIRAGKYLHTAAHHAGNWRETTLDEIPCRRARQRSAKFGFLLFDNYPVKIKHGN